MSVSTFPSREPVLHRVLVVAALLLVAACGSAEPTTSSPRPPSETRTTQSSGGSAPDHGGVRPETTAGTTAEESPPADAAPDDPFGLLAVEWPGTIGEAALLLDRLPAWLGAEERTPPVAFDDWFLVGNIPILATGDDTGRVVVGYVEEVLERAVVAQPSASPVESLWGFLVWGGAPEHCPDVEGSAAVIDGDAFDLEALATADAAGDAVWLSCTMQRNPDTGNDVEDPDDWAYGIGWTTATMTYFVVARSPEQRDELVRELVDALGREAPPSDPGNPLFDSEGPAAWWPGGVLLTCAFTDDGAGVIRFDPVSGTTTVLADSMCGQVSPSPDGTQLVFDDYAESGEVIRLWIADRDGGSRRPLTDPPVGATPADGDRATAWSPTGEWIAFERGGDRIYVIRPDGTGLRSVADGRAPRWSSDGSILLARRGTSDVAAVRLSDGSTAFVIPDTLDAAWSPSEPLIAYERDGVLRLWSPESGDLGPVAGLESLGDVAQPVWSPDGEFVLADSARFGAVVVERATGTIHRLGFRPGGDVGRAAVWVAS